jgi:cytochrome c oxidase subunit 3
MQALPAAPAPAPRNQLTVGASLAAGAIVMLFGGMLAVWAVQRNRAIDLEGRWLPDGVTVPEVPSNVMLIAFAPVCIFAYWAQWSAKRKDNPHTALALSATAFMGLLILNAQFFVYHDMGLGIADGPYESMFYAITGTFVALLILGMLVSVVSAFRFLGGRTSDHEMLIAHSIVWYAITAVYCGIWFLVYVTK